MARRLTAFGLAAALLGAGCADDPEIDVLALEASVAESMLPAVVELIECPRPLAIEAQRVTCRGEIDGVEIDLEVELEPDDEDGVLADVSIDVPLLDVTEVAITAGDRLSEDLGVVALVRCDTPVIVIEPGRELACFVTDLADGIERPLLIRLLDADGAWEMDLTG